VKIDYSFLFPSDEERRARRHWALVTYTSLIAVSFVILSVQVFDIARAEKWSWSLVLGLGQPLLLLLICGPKLRDKWADREAGND
jgi:hypothetical protein